VADPSHGRTHGPPGTDKETIVAKPVVVIAEELSPATVDALGPDFDIRHVDGTDRAALLASISEAHALLVRSATQVDAEVFAAGPQLVVVARAGVGLDNVDVTAATSAGVMVVNAPTSNIISAAELAIGHLLSLARMIPDAHASMKAGEWKRSKFTGVEFFDKTVGIVGLGRIGALVAERLSSFGVTLVAYDPFVPPARAQQLGVQMVELDELMERSDFITVHIPKTPETTGLIGADQFAKAKPSLRIVNASRGGIIDESALVDALSSNRIAGAALDVFVNEPPTDSPLLGLDNIQLTPHLGASTDEAQEKAGVSVAKSVKLALEGELVPDAVNVAGGAIDESVRPGLPLMEKLGQIFAGLANLAIAAIDVEIRGEIAQFDVSALKLAALKGVFSAMLSEQVSFVNAPLLAEQRGVAVRLVTETASDEYRNLLTIRGTLVDGSRISVAGTLTGQRQTQKIVSINDFDVEVPMAQHFIVMMYTDRPGIVAVYGREFGAANVNIAGMQIARQKRGGTALSILTVDSRVDDAVLSTVAQEIDASLMKAIEVVER
jgi:D-3-phosphoglycerate dehydrogenase / 2-oxoglutarate reductase